jgi:hypothetical protein
MESAGTVGFVVVEVWQTAGDSYRHLSSKTDTSWKIERWMIHSVLVFSFDDHRRYIFILI